MAILRRRRFVRQCCVIAAQTGAKRIPSTAWASGDTFLAEARDTSGGHFID